MSEERRSPWIAQVVLLVVFLAIGAIGVFTVLIPELSDAGEEAEAAAVEDEAPAEE